MEIVRDSMKGYSGLTLVHGFYPDIQGFKYVLKSSTTSKYGQIARIFAAIFNVSPYYDLAISALKKYTFNVYRKVAFNDSGYSFEPEIIKHEPDLKYYYKQYFE